MKALIAFILMAACIVALIEINERRKAKQGKEKASHCEKPKSDEDCSECGLIDICTKEEKKSTSEQ